MSLRSRVLAAPWLGARLGGVGQVSAMTWRALEAAWPAECDLVTLLPNGHVNPTALDKVRFGSRMLLRQAASTRWILFTHLGLARVQRRIPGRWRSPFAVFLHGVEAWSPLPPADRLLVRSAAIRLANSEFTARRAREANPDIGHISVCPLALDADTRTAPAGSPGTGKRVLIVGRLASGERYKGHDELIEAWPAVIRVEPDAELVIVGEGDDRARLEALARDSGASHRITFTGFVTPEELRGHYSRAAVFALPSRGEGFGLVYLEAMWHGLPCIGSTADAAREVLVDGETGVLVDPADTGALAGAILRLLSDGELRTRLGRGGRARVEKYFLFQHFETRLVGTLRAAFGEGSTSTVMR